MMNREPSSRPGAVNNSARFIVTAVLVVILLAVLFALAQPHVYLFKRVEPGFIGVRIQGGRIVEIVPPGVYSDIGLFVRMETYSTQAYQFSVTDPELITSDNQRLGVTVSGSMFRPDFTKADRISDLWARYRQTLHQRRGFASCGQRPERPGHEGLRGQPSLPRSHHRHRPRRPAQVCRSKN